MRNVLLFFILILSSAASVPAGAANIAVIVSADVDAYQEALRGFKETIGHRIVAEYDMEGDFDRGREILEEIRSKVKPDLILAVGVWALQVIVNEPVDLPVVFTMVLNPPSILSGEARNITGASMNVPVDQSIKLLKQLDPEIRRIGVIYNRARTGYLVTQAKVVAQEEQIQLITRDVLSGKEAIQAVNSLHQDGTEIFWILPDQTVLAPKVVEYMLLFSYRNKIPLLGLSERQAQMGALLSLSFGSSEDIGRQSAELSNAILAGRPAGAIPFTTARTIKVTVNLKAAKKLGLEIPDSILAMADTVIR